MNILESVLKTVDEFELEYKTHADWQGAKVIEVESIGTFFLHTEGENRSVFFSNVLRDGVSKPSHKLFEAINQYNAMSSVAKMYIDDGNLYLTAFLIINSPEQASDAVSIIISDIIDEDKFDTVEKIFKEIR